MSFIKSELRSTFQEAIDDYIMEATVWDDCKELLKAELLEFLTDPAFPNRMKEFKTDLAKACLEGFVTIGDYKAWRGDMFDTQFELDGFFVEIWHDLFGDEPIKIP